jgi:hypothetical protein
MESLLLPCGATGVSLLTVWCLLGATPRGQPWTSAVPLPPGRNGLGARRRAVLSTFRALSLGRHVHRELMRSVWLDLTPIIAATACHQRNYVERYSRFNDGSRTNLQHPRRIADPAAIETHVHNLLVDRRSTSFVEESQLKPTFKG